MNTSKELEHIYKQSLEQNIIEDISAKKHIELRHAVEIYYKSKLAIQIGTGEYGIQYLDYHVLADDLIDNESELFLSH